VQWRRQFSLLLGLERLLSEDEPQLVDGTVLSAHQVDALSGTLTALLAEAQRSANGNAPQASSNGNGQGNGATAEAASSRSEDERSPARKRVEANGAADDEDPDDDGEEEPEDEENEDEEPQDWQDDVDEEDAQLGSSPRIPTPPSDSGSSTRRAPVRRWPRSASWRPHGPPAS